MTERPRLLEPLQRQHLLHRMKHGPAVPRDMLPDLLRHIVEKELKINISERVAEYEQELKDWLKETEDTHTPSPEGYIAWHNWAERKLKTHHQIKCRCCGLYTVWVKNDAATKGTTAGRTNSRQRLSGRRSQKDSVKHKHKAPSLDVLEKRDAGAKNSRKRSR
jgi:hypothetical protein